MNIKQWILNRPFIKAEIIKRCNLVRDELISITPDEIQEEATKQLNDLLSIVDLKKIVTLDKARGIVYIGGVKAEEGTLSNLKAEAEFITKSDLWQLIHETPKELAQRAMFVSSESLDDMKKGKAMLYTLSCQQNIIDTFKSFEKK